MAKKPTFHPYADRSAFERLMLLIATLVQYPGVGSSDNEDTPLLTNATYHDALLPVQARLQAVAVALGIELPEGYPATPTIRKDLETLRRYGILEQRMYRWGLNLGELEEQQAELQGQLRFETVKVRFFPPVIAFILEGNRRHPRQKIRLGPKDSITGQFAYVDYIIALPPRSLEEFVLWVYRYMDKAQVLSPPNLVEKHSKAARALVTRYS